MSFNRNVVARLKPGITLDQARSEMVVIQSHLARPDLLSQFREELSAGQRKVMQDAAALRENMETWLPLDVKPETKEVTAALKRAGCGDAGDRPASFQDMRKLGLSQRRRRRARRCIPAAETGDKGRPNGSMNSAHGPVAVGTVPSRSLML